MKYRTNGSSITVILPLTTPTGKVRVKRPRPGLASEPVACRSNPILEGDYLEWQISYDTNNLHDPSLVKEVILQKESGVRYGCELVRLLVEAKKLSLISDQQLEELRFLLNNSSEGIEEAEQIAFQLAEESRLKIGESHSFRRYDLITPVYLKDCSAYKVEIKIAHKQKAVGNQAMVYVHLPVQHCRGGESSSLIGRIAEKKEEAEYVINSGNSGLIYDTVIAFAIASRKHRQDLAQIFTALGF